jgi:hypothetical protein
MTIETERVVDKNGERMYKVVNIGDVIKKENLPEKYLSGAPAFWKSDTWNLHVLSKSSPPKEIIIRPHTTFKEAVFVEILKEMETAGERLKAIKDKHRETKEIWNGKETFII